MWYLNEYNRHNISIHMQGFTNPTVTLRKIQDGRQRWPQMNPFGEQQKLFPNFAMGTTKTVLQYGTRHFQDSKYGA